MAKKTRRRRPVLDVIRLQNGPRVDKVRYPAKEH